MLSYQYVYLHSHVLFQLNITLIILFVPSQGPESLGYYKSLLWLNNARSPWLLIFFKQVQRTKVNSAFRSQTESGVLSCHSARLTF